MKKIQGLVAAMATSALLVGCAKTDFSFVTESALLNPPTSIDANGFVTDSFTSTNAAPKVDMLFCVDSSGSMGDDQTTLANNFSTFIDQFVQQNIDFHIGLITTDISSTDPSYWSSRFPNYVDANVGKLLTRYSQYPVLTNSTPNLVDRFKANVKVGTSGSGYEQCLGSMLAATETSKLIGSNAGLFRADSLQSFIIVSDEDETITDGTDPAVRIQALKDRVNGLRTIASRGSRFDFVINESAAPQVQAPNAGSRPYPEIYHQAATALGGLKYDITQNFASALLQISQGIVNQAQNEFKLSSIPRNSSEMIVKIGTDAIPAGASNGYVYHADRNTIELTGGMPDQAVGKTITAYYLPR